MDLLGHSAGAGISMMYAALYPHRIEHLVLVTPGLRAVGADLSAKEWLELVKIRRDEPWFENAYAAALRAAVGEDAYQEVAPFYYGRWDEAAAEHFNSQDMYRFPEAMTGYFAEGAFDPQRTLTGLSALRAPTLVLAGELDPGPTPAAVASLVATLGDGTLLVQPGGGHYPWLDDPSWFTNAINGFLDH
jgi:pimeloyl-ACP methyl ester carboxylesterase